MKRLINRFLAAALLTTAATASQFAYPADRYHFEGLSLHKNAIFTAINGRIYEGNITGSAPQALTNSKHYDSMPLISPDGKWLAFSREKGGNRDVYLLDRSNNSILRKTYHPMNDEAVAWSNDSKTLYFKSNRDTARGNQLFSVTLKNGWPKKHPFPMLEQLTISAKDASWTYVPRGVFPGNGEFRYYRGGMRAGIYQLNKDTLEVSLIEGETYNAFSPRKVNEDLYFISDKDGIHNLHIRQDGMNESQQLTAYTSVGLRYLASDDTNLVFSQGGQLFRWHSTKNQAEKIQFDLGGPKNTDNTKRLNVSRWHSNILPNQDASEMFINARGDIFTFNLKTKKTRNLTKSAGVNEHNLSLSKDGEKLAYISDKSDANALAIRSLADNTEAIYPIETPSSFYFDLSWSPTNKLISFADHRLQLWIFDTETKEAKVIDTSVDSGQNAWQTSWSPGGRYLAYSKRLSNRLPAIFIFDTKANKSFQVTPGDIYAISPSFDPTGDYLYFVSSPNRAASDFKWSVLSGIDQGSHIRGNLNYVLLNPKAPHPIISTTHQPNTEVNWQQSTHDDSINFATLADKIFPIYLENKGINSVEAIMPGELIVTAMAWSKNPMLTDRPRVSLHSLSLKNPNQLTRIAYNVQQYIASADGDHLIQRRDADFVKFSLTPLGAEVMEYRWPALQAQVDKKREWQQIYREAWRYAREQFYDPNMHGVNSAEVESFYAKFLPNIDNRTSLTRFMRRAFGHLSVSHLYISGGDNRDTTPTAPIGLLGADIVLNNGAYQIEKIYRYNQFDERENLYSPLSQPGVQIEKGEYIVAVNGKHIDSKYNFYRYFRGLANRSIELTLSATPSGKEQRKVTVKPVLSDTLLRQADWAEANKRYVEKQTNGNVAYVHVQGFNGLGIERFLRAFYGAMGKRGFIIDQRFNGGGITPDYLISMLQRSPLYAYKFRNGLDLTVPVNNFAGNKVLITNEFNGSAAETFATMFRQGKLGKTVGQQTFGAGIGPYGFNMQTIDGGRIQVPNRGAYQFNNSWGIENLGVPADVPRQIWPKDIKRGVDTQLDTAIMEAMKPLNKKPIAHPSFPIHP